MHGQNINLTVCVCVCVYVCHHLHLKGDKALCGNSRGISLLSVAGKVLARVMLWRLLTHVVDIVMPELQSGFRRGRGTIDMIFVARLLQEKCHESDPFDVLAGLNKAVSWLPSSSTYSWSPLLWSSEMDSLQMLEFPSTSGWMAIYSISDGCRRRPKSHQTPFSTYSMQTMQQYPAIQQSDSNIVLTYLLPHINVLD